MSMTYGHPDTDTLLHQLGTDFSGKTSADHRREHIQQEKKNHSVTKNGIVGGFIIGGLAWFLFGIESGWTLGNFVICFILATFTIMFILDPIYKDS